MQKSIDEKSIFFDRIIAEAQRENPFAAVGEIVTKTLETAILTSRFPAGSRLNISKISKALGVSSTPVRNAIDVLAQDGLIDISTGTDGRYKTYIVFDPDPGEIEDIFVARKTIESMAAYLCADRPWTVNLKRLHTLADQFFTACSNMLTAMSRAARSTKTITSIESFTE